MAINHPQWVAGTATQRLISTARMNQLTDDACNLADDIHPQYGVPIYKCDALHVFGFRLASGPPTYLPIFNLHRIQHDSTVIVEDKFVNIIGMSDSTILLTKLQFRILTSLSYVSLANISMQVATDDPSADHQLRGMILVNGTKVDEIAISITSTYPSYQDINEVLNLGSLSIGDIVEMFISVYKRDYLTSLVYLKNTAITLT